MYGNSQQELVRPEHGQVFAFRKGPYVKDERAVPPAGKQHRAICRGDGADIMGSLAVSGYTRNVLLDQRVAETPNREQQNHIRGYSCRQTSDNRKYREKHKGEDKEYGVTLGRYCNEREECITQEQPHYKEK